MFQTATSARRPAGKLWCSPTHWDALLQERCVDEDSHTQGRGRILVDFNHHFEKREKTHSSIPFQWAMENRRIVLTVSFSFFL
jgi:hypothetical protein